jgi:hypothetical protein
MIAIKEKRPLVSYRPTASEYFGQPFSVEPLLCELHFFPDHIRDDRNSILNLQFLDLPVAELLAETDQPRPRFGDALCQFPVLFVFGLMNHNTTLPTRRPIPRTAANLWRAIQLLNLVVEWHLVLTACN